jgi:hypothetical protein
MTTEIAKEVMDPETETDMHQVPGGDITPIAKPRIQRKTATDVDAMIVNDPVDTTIRTEREIGRGAADTVMRDHGVGHPRLRGTGI